MRWDIVYEIKYLIYCIRSRGIWIEFYWVPSHCGLYWNEISNKLAKQVAMKNMSEIYTITYNFCIMKLRQYLKRLCIKNFKKVHLQCLLVRGI